MLKVDAVAHRTALASGGRSSAATSAPAAQQSMTSMQSMTSTWTLAQPRAHSKAPAAGRASQKRKKGWEDDHADKEAEFRRVEEAESRKAGF